MDMPDRDFMIAHLTLHGWAPVNINSVLIVNVAQRIYLTAFYMARKWYAGEVFAYGLTENPTPHDDWGGIATAALEALFKELTADEEPDQ